MQAFCLLKLHHFFVPGASSTATLISHGLSWPWRWRSLKGPDRKQWERCQQSCEISASLWAINSLQYSQRKWRDFQNHLLGSSTKYILSHSDLLPSPTSKSMISWKKPPIGSDWIHPHRWSHTSLFWALSQLEVQLSLFLASLTQRGAFYTTIVPRKHQQSHTFWGIAPKTYPCMWYEPQECKHSFR